jgi:exonuclease VII small subunit
MQHPAIRSRFRTPWSRLQDALELLQDALMQLQDALELLQDALMLLQDALELLQDALMQLQDALEQLQDALEQAARPAGAMRQSKHANTSASVVCSNCKTSS